MRNPIGSETDAFRVTVAGAALGVVCALVGWLAGTLVGVILFVVLGPLALSAYLLSTEPRHARPLRRAIAEPHAHGARDGSRHVLVIAHEALEGRELVDHIRALGGSGVEIDVLAPLLSSRVHLAFTDIDEELDEARSRLARSLAWARAWGFPARGEVGGPSPTPAIEDELRDFGADEVVVVTADGQAADWQEQVELEHLREQLDVPVIHLTTS
jgi:hypothetical protein